MLHPAFHLLGLVLKSISRNDTSDDFIIPEKLYYYTKVYEIFNHYQNFDIEIYTLNFTYNLYLSSVNFKTRIVTMIILILIQFLIIL